MLTSLSLVLVFAQLFTGIQDERQPFTPEEEEAVLRVLRVKRVWYAFDIHIGTLGI